MKQTNHFKENLVECLYHLGVGKIFFITTKQAETTKEKTGRFEDVTTCKFYISHFHKILKDKTN